MERSGDQDGFISDMDSVVAIYLLGQRPVARMIKYLSIYKSGLTKDNLMAKSGINSQTYETYMPQMLTARLVLERNDKIYETNYTTALFTGIQALRGDLPLGFSLDDTDFEISRLLVDEGFCGLNRLYELSGIEPKELELHIDHLAKAGFVKKKGREIFGFKPSFKLGKNALLAYMVLVSEGVFGEDNI